MVFPGIWPNTNNTWHLCIALHIQNTFWILITRLEGQRDSGSRALTYSGSGILLQTGESGGRGRWCGYPYNLISDFISPVLSQKPCPAGGRLVATSAVCLAHV